MRTEIHDHDILNAVKRIAFEAVEHAKPVQLFTALLINLALYLNTVTRCSFKLNRQAEHFYRLKSLSHDNTF